MTRIIFLICLLFSPWIMNGGTQDSLKTCKWFVPDHIKLQFAGNIGLISIGPGYRYAKDRMEIDLMYGYVPEAAGGTLHSLTLKNTWIPFEPVPAGKKLAIDVITLGLPVSYTFGKQFFVVPPHDQYPSRYYDYSSAIRFGIFAGGKINYLCSEEKRIKSAALYYEVGTYDLLLHNYIFNTGTMHFGNLFNLALGLQFRFD